METPTPNNPPIGTDLSIVITHYKTPDILKTCLDKLRAFAPAAKLLVVDSDSGKDIQIQLESLLQGVELIKTSNHSMASAVNEGLKRTDTPYVMQMNADVFIHETTVPDLIARLKRKHLAMVGPICLDDNGKRQQQGILYNRFYYLMKLFRAKSIPVYWLSGCCQMIKRDVLETIGGMNASYRFYNEDMEWCWRIRRTGLHCELVDTPVTHLGGSATPDDPRFLIEGYRGAMQLAMQYKPKSYQRLHRFYVRLEASLKSRFARNEASRRTYRTINRMFSRRQFEASPFGRTLTETNPNFRL